MNWGRLRPPCSRPIPKGNRSWTGLYYDETANYWTITYEVPVDYQGRHLFNPSFDVNLEAIMNRSNTDPSRKEDTILSSVTTAIWFLIRANWMKI